MTKAKNRKQLVTTSDGYKTNQHHSEKKPTELRNAPYAKSRKAHPVSWNNLDLPTNGGT